LENVWRSIICSENILWLQTFFLKRPGELSIFILRGKRVDNPYIHPTIQVHTHAHPGITNYIHAGAKSEKLPGLDQKLTGIQW